MAKIRLIKRRIKAAKNISQITKAMEMVAASKMKRSQERALRGKPYAEKIKEAIAALLFKTTIKKEEFPILRENRGAGKDLVILISTNKGLCGGLNTNLFKAVNSWFPDNFPTDFVNFGNKGKNFLVRTGRNLIADFSGGNFQENIGALLDLVVNAYSQERKYGHVYLIYNNFVSILSQIPVKEVLLPLGEILPAEKPNEEKLDFLIEPDIKTLLNSLLPHYLEIILRKAFNEAEASEQSARMLAMKAATDNALNLMTELTLEYNKERQQLITYEIADIITAKEAIL